MLIWLALAAAIGVPVMVGATVFVGGVGTTAVTTEAAVAALRAELQPIDDVRSTAAYRREVACRVLRRILEDDAARGGRPGRK